MKGFQNSKTDYPLSSWYDSEMCKHKFAYQIIVG
jgi:hypothetical protein